jgi:hypothetical protein
VSRVALALSALVLALALAGGCGRLGYDPLPLSASIDAATTDAPADATATDAPPDPDAAPAPDYCSVLPALASAPVLDGVLEPGLTLRELVPVAWIGPGAAPPAGQSARYAAAWRPDGLYAYVEVVDPSRVPAPSSQFRWCGDGVEVYVDDDGSFASPPAYDDPGTRQIIVAAPTDATTPVQGGEAWCSSCGDTVPTELPGAALVAVPRRDGYAIEALVVASDLARTSWTLAAGRRVGFDLAVNVSTPAPTNDACVFDGTSRGSDLGQYFLSATSAGAIFPFDHVQAFCTPALLPP